MAVDRNKMIDVLLEAYRALQGDIDEQIETSLVEFRANLGRIEEEHRIKREEIARLEAETSTKPLKDKWRHQVEIQEKTKALELIEEKRVRINKDIAVEDSDLNAFHALEVELEALRTSGGNMTSVVKKLDGYISRSVDSNNRNKLRAGIGRVMPDFVGVIPPPKPDQGLGAIPVGAAKRGLTGTAFVTPPRPAVGRLLVQPGVVAGMGAAATALGKMRRPGSDVPIDTWELFFNKIDIDNVKDQVKDKPALAVQGITPEHFSDSLKSIPDTLKSYSTTGVKTFHVKSKSDQQYTVFKGNDETDEANPIMKISHVPAEKPSDTNQTLKPSVVNITLTDKSDHSLYLSVVAAKDLLERAGSQSKRFFIENCANDPEKAVKLFIIGKSLGLTPAFRDEAAMEASFEAAKNWILKSGVETLSLHDLYKKTKNCSEKEAEELIKNLEFKQVPALGANPAAPRLPFPGAVATPFMPKPVATAPPLAPVAAPAPPPPPPPAAGGGSAPLTLAEQLAAGTRGLKKPRPPGFPR